MSVFMFAALAPRLGQNPSSPRTAADENPGHLGPGEGRSDRALRQLRFVCNDQQLLSLPALSLSLGRGPWGFPKGHVPWMTAAEVTGPLSAFHPDDHCPRASLAFLLPGWTRWSCSLGSLSETGASPGRRTGVLNPCALRGTRFTVHPVILNGP